jgi:predicted DNA-binding antitoxin AbrB/MazE fold protein
MDHQFHAIYENGILRPTAPLDLPESVEVSVTIHQRNGIDHQQVVPNADELRRQQEALDRMFREIEQLPQSPRNDGLSGRDHDRILYGNRS